MDPNLEPAREILDAFVDGELPPKEMERIAALLATRPDLDAYVTRQEKFRAALRTPFDDILAAPAPQRLVDAVHVAPVSWLWRLRTVLGRRFVARSLIPAGATLALGLMIGLALQPARDLGLSASGQMLAQGTLGHALDTTLASAGYDGRGPHIGISFRNKAGEDCRTFSSGNNAGFACRRDGAWVVGTLVTQPPEVAAAYRMAGSEMPNAVRRAVEADIDGVPFDAAAEARARAHGWSGP